MTPSIFLSTSNPAMWMCAAGLVLLPIGLASAKNDIGNARGIDKVAALTYTCFGVALAIFGAEHFAIPGALHAMVPSYMPWRLFWVYFIGVSLIAAALSIATKRYVRWSGLLFGVLMFLFVAMLHLPGAIKAGGRFPWTIVVREMSFGAGGLVLAGIALCRTRERQGKRLLSLAYLPIAIAAIFFGVEHFLHPLGLPGVPLAKQMPPWVPARTLIDYVTGALLLFAGACVFVPKKRRLAAGYAGAWILLLVVTIYVPVMVGALGNPGAGVQIEGVNYFADTLLFGGVILSLSAKTRKLI